MAWFVDPGKLRALWNVIEREPGVKVSEAAHRLGWTYHEVYRLLPSLDRHGLLVSEDRRGGLYAFGEEGAYVGAGFDSMQLH